MAVADRGGGFFRRRLAVQTMEAAPDALALDTVPDRARLASAQVPQPRCIHHPRSRQPPLHPRPYARIFRQRQAQQRTRQFVGSQNRQPRRLLHPARRLCQKTRRSQSHRRAQTVPDILQNARLYPPRQGHGIGLQTFGAPQLARTFVDGADLPYRHMAVDLGHDLLVDLDIEIGPGLGDDQAGAKLARLRHPHPRMDTKGLALIAGGDGPVYSLLAGRTMTGLPRQSGFICCSTLAKKAFRSMNNQRRPALSSSARAFPNSIDGTYQERL